MSMKLDPSGWTRHFVGCLLFAALVGAIPTAAFAQARSNKYNFDNAPVQQPAQLLADHMLNLATDALAGSGKVRDDQYQRASILLQMASKLDPQDAELWQLDAELASRMDDQNRWQTAISHYIDLRPKDDAAQLELILAQLDKLQTADARLGRLQAILESKQAKGLSKPLRSRLASYAALAAEQIGDNQKYAHWLSIAASLDPANEQAAMMIYQLALQHHASPVMRGAALIRLVESSPMDGDNRIALAQILVGQAVYNRAARQFGIGRALSDQTFNPETYRLWALSLAAAGLADQAMQLLDQVEKANAPATQPATQSSATQPSSTPSESSLPLKLELLRLAIASSQNDTSQVKTSFKSIRKTLMSGGKVKEKANAQKNLAWIAAVFNVDIALAKAYLKNAPANDPTAELARGWLAIHAKEDDAAIKALKPIVDKDPLAQLGIAILNGVSDENRAKALQAVVRQSPDSLAGMLAASKLQNTKHAVYPTDEGKSLDSAMSDTPSDVWHMGDPSSWIDLEINVKPTRAGYLRPIDASVTIRNTTQMPLSMGPQASIHGKMLFQISPFAAGNSMGSVAPKVVDGNHRITLGPGDTIKLNVNLNRSSLGKLVLHHPFTTIIYNVSAQLDPRAKSGGGMTHGLLGSSDLDRSLQAWAIPATTSNIKSWLDDLKGDPSISRMQAIARLVQVNAKSAPDLDSKTLDHIADAINNAYPNFGEDAKAWTILCMGNTPDDRTRFRRVFELAQRSTDPMVQAVYLATKVDNLKSPVLAQAIRSDNTTMHAFALATQAAIKAKAAAKATTQPATDNTPTDNTPADKAAAVNAPTNKTP